MDLFHKILALVDKNSDRIPEGDYLELCDTIQTLREQVKPPSFLINQNQPLTLPSDPETAAQRDREQLYQRWRELDEEVMYPGLNEFLQELHEDWAATDHDGPVEPGFYYPPPRDGTTVAEVTLTPGPDA
jgi:hypothetical protein